MPPSPRATTHLLLIAVQLCFASLAVVGKQALFTIPPDVVVLTRIAGGAAVFFVLARRRGPIRLARADVAPVFGCALLGVVLNQVLFLHGLARTTAVNASVLGATIPLFTIGFAMLGRVEPFRPRRLAGILLGLAGTLVLVGVERMSLADRHTAGNLMVVANAVSYAGFLVAVRPLSRRIAPLPLVALLFAAGTCYTAPLGIPAWIDFAPRLRAADAGFLAFLVAVPTVLAYSLNQAAIRRADASLVAVYIYLQPVFATLGATLLLGERPGARAAVAGALVLGGLLLATRR